MFRHDASQLDYNLEESFKQNGIGVEKFQSMVQQLSSDGVVDRDFLRGMWSGLVNPESTKQLVEVIVLMLEHFELGYPQLRSGVSGVKMSDTFVPVKQRRKSRASLERPASSASAAQEALTSARTKSPSRDMLSASRHSRAESTSTGHDVTIQEGGVTSSLPKISKFVVPWMRRGGESRAVTSDLKSLQQNPALVALFKSVSIPIDNCHANLQTRAFVRWFSGFPPTCLPGCSKRCVCAR